LWESTAESGLFAVKGDLFQILPFLFTPTFQRLMANIKFVYVTREDVLLQAVSLVIAHHTGRWTSDTAVHDNYVADINEITDNVRMLTQMMAGWETVFSFSGIRPLRLTHEQIESDLNACIQKIASHVDVLLPSGALDLVEVTLKPTRNEMNYKLRRCAIDLLGIIATTSPCTTC
jgi:LPS sulfotransferase NodH